MEPGIHQNEYLLVSKAVYLFQQPQRGDVVVFHYPLDIHKDFIKRIIGIPGDTIQITKTTVSINSRIIVEPYTSHPFTYDRNTWKLGPEQFFVMGDNRDNSFDSRDWGPLERSYIVGKVVAIYWPLPNWSFINTYPSVYAAVPMPK
jgi:signal peptidase I